MEGLTTTKECCKVQSDCSNLWPACAIFRHNAGGDAWRMRVQRLWAQIQPMEKKGWEQVQTGKERAGIVQGKKMAANQIIEGQGCAFTEVNVLQPVVCFKVPHSYCWIAMEVELLEVLQDASPALVAAWEDKNFQQGLNCWRRSSQLHHHG